MAKKSSRWEGEGDKGGKGGKKQKNGKKLKEKKVRNGKEKKNMEGGRIAVARVDLAQESNALPITYCDSQASL